MEITVSYIGEILILLKGLIFMSNKIKTFAKKHKVVLIASGVGVVALTAIGFILKSKVLTEVKDLVSLDIGDINEEILYDVEPFQIGYFGDCGKRCITIPDGSVKITFENFVGILSELKDIVGKDAKIDPEMTQIWLPGKE